MSIVECGSGRSRGVFVGLNVDATCERWEVVSLIAGGCGVCDRGLQFGVVRVL